MLAVVTAAMLTRQCHQCGRLSWLNCQLSSAR